MAKDVDWKAIEARFGDGQQASIRSIAAEFNTPESTVRRKATAEEWTRDRLRSRLDSMRTFFELQMRLIEEEIGRRVTHPVAPHDARRDTIDE